MAVNERQLKITLRALIGDFINPLKTAKTEIVSFGETVDKTFDKIEKRSENMQHVWKDMLEAFVGVEIVDQLLKIAEGAARADDAMTIAARTAKNLGKSFNADEMEAWLEKLSKSAEGGGYAINELRDATQQFAAVGATGAQSQRLLIASIGLAATKQITLTEAVHANTEAAIGNDGMLRRLGVTTRDAADNTLSFSQIITNELNSAMGNAEQRANGLEGALGRLATAGNKLVTGPFGKTLAQIFITAINAVTGLVNAVNALPAPFLAAAASGLALFGGLSALGLLLPVVKLAFGFLAEGVLLARDIFGLFLRSAFLVIGGLRDLVTWVSLARDALATMAIAEWLAEAPILAIVGSIALLIGLVVEAVRGFKDLGNIWSWLTGLFKTGTLPHMKGPKTSMDGLGGPDKNAQKTIDDWLTAKKAEIDAAVQIAVEAVDAANARLTAASAQLEELRAKRDPTKALTQGSVSEEERLIGVQLQRERDLRAAIANQRGAELTAARQLNALAGALPAADKDRVTHATALRSEAEKHVVAAIKLGGEYDKLGGVLAKMARDAADVARSFGQQVAALAKISAERLYQSTLAERGADQAHAKSLFEQGNVRPANGPIEEARRATGAAQFDYTSATNSRSQAQADLAYAKAAQQAAYVAAAFQDVTTAAQTRADADLAVQRAEVAVRESMDDLALASKRLTEAKAEERATTAKTLLGATAGKLPGVSVGATGALGFNPAALFADVITQSKSFADVMQLVNEIMSTLVQILDTFEPVVDALLKVVAIVVNGFIGLWNAIVRLIGLIGIHLQQLQYINENFGPAATQMITFVHDIPTLNELASGNISPLVANGSNSTSPLNQINQDLLNNDQHQQTWFGSVITALGALLVIDWLTHGNFLSGLGQWIPQIWNNIGSFFTQLPQTLGGIWNNFQNWLSGTFGPQLAGFVDVAGGVALLDTHTQGIAGWLEKIVGILLIVQGIMQEMGAGSIFGGAGGGASTGNLLTKLFGGGGSSGLSSTMVTPGTIPEVEYGPDGSIILPNDAGDADMANASSGGWGSTAAATGGKFSLGGALAGIGIGATEASIISKLVGGNATNSSIGGMIGGGIGGAMSIFGLAAGPLGALAGGALGSLLGGLIGPKYNASNNPDMFDGTTNYTQLRDDAMGGTTMDSSTASATGGLGLVRLIGKYIQQTGGTGLASNLVSEFSGDTDASVMSLHQGNWTMANGFVGNWQQIVTDAQTAIQQITATINQGTSSIGGGDQAPIDQRIAAAVAQIPGAQPITNNIYIDTVNGYDDVTQLGTDLANAQQRVTQSRQYLSTRVTTV